MARTTESKVIKHYCDIDGVPTMFIASDSGVWVQQGNTHVPEERRMVFLGSVGGFNSFQNELDYVLEMVKAMVPLEAEVRPAQQTCWYVDSACGVCGEHLATNGNEVWKTCKCPVSPPDCD